MKPLVALGLAAIATVGAAALSYVAGQRVESTRNTFLRQHESLRVYQLHTAALASADALTRESALWYEVASLQYGSDPLGAVVNDSARAKDIALAYARLSETAAAQGHSDRAAALLQRAEALCPRIAWAQCSGAELLSVAKRLTPGEAKPLERKQ